MTKVAAYYNENDPFAAAWLRNLIKASLIADGEVDERSITEVQADEVKGFTQCHFFAGIGVWSLALREAGWRDSTPVWTGSCPCQPFSKAGRGKGTEDERHLWPELFRLIEECQPPIVFGEQVASPAGRSWLSGVFVDLETVGYATAGADLCAASVNSPHIRQRLWWVADSRQQQCVGWDPIRDTERTARGSEEEGQGTGTGRERTLHDAADGCPSCWVGDSEFERLERYSRNGTSGQESRRHEEIENGPIASTGSNSWDDFVWIPCADGKARRIEPGLEPLVNGDTERVGRLRAYGNAIVPQVATEFILAVKECRP